MNILKKCFFRQALQISIVIFCLLPIVFLNGCKTLDIAKKEDVAQVRTSVSEELIDIRDDIRYINGRLDELEQELAEISTAQTQQNKEINNLLKEWKSDTKNTIERSNENLRSEIAALEKKQKQNNQEIQKKLNIVLEEVTSENKAIRKQIESLRKSQSYSSDGYHIVSKGDTLSRIAQSYGVSIRALMDTNDISNPNNIRLGQKLIIPE